MDLTLRALNRFGLGARPGERREISDPRGWLRAQLDGSPPEVTVPQIADAHAIGDALRAVRSAAPLGAQDRQAARRRLVEIAAAEAHAGLATRVATERPFVERLVAFWSNHLCVSAAAKLLVAPLAGSYEREAIRPHVLGRFEDMVLASAKHPAMLLYLDNFQSVGPSSLGSQRGRGGRVQRGLNENYARELLELHTLGVDGGYTQEDVQELAKVLTGWTIDGLFALSMGAGTGRLRRLPVSGAAGEVLPSAGPVRFVFQDLLHEPGVKTVLGARYEGGISEGEQVIRRLCRHPSTSRFVAAKLVAHFAADQPPTDAVERIARVFRDSDGDLRVVARAVINVPEAWSAGSRKFRTPQDWLVAVLRAFSAAGASEAVASVLRQLRHPLWSPPSPKGFGDTTEEWADPGSLLNRAELARRFARRLGARKMDPRTLLDLIDVDPADPLHDVLSNTSLAADERVALAIAAPAFQWR